MATGVWVAEAERGSARFVFRLPSGSGVLLLSSHSGTQTEGDVVSWVLCFSWQRLSSQEPELKPPCLLSLCSEGAVTLTLILLVKASHMGGGQEEL